MPAGVRSGAARRRLRELRCHLGQESAAPESLAPTPAAAERPLDAVIVGAGFAGLYAIRKLRDELGLNVVALETGSGVGGTWFWNRYPGARCDVHSVEYSFSWDDELQQEWDWEEVMAAQPQILEYADHVADRFDLTRSIQFETKVVGCAFNEATEQWAVTTDRGDTFSAQFLIGCVGCLSTPNEPGGANDIPGVADFEGPVYHTGRWPHDVSPEDLRGQRVGIIGTGSSGIQSIPVIAEHAEHLTVFQRTAQYSLPANNHDVDEDYRAMIKGNYGPLRELAKKSPAGFITGFGGRTSATDGTHMPEPQMYAIMDMTPEERLEALEREGFELFRQLSDVGMSMEANAVACDLFATHLRNVVHDPDTAAKLTPSGQPFGCKRQVMDTDYYVTCTLPPPPQPPSPLPPAPC